MQYFLKTVYMETRLSQDLLHYMELLKKMFPITLNMKNANRVQKDFFFKIAPEIEQLILVSLWP